MKPAPKPLISVIVPIYNASYFLHKCIHSITNQDYKHLEIILIDDGSTDDSLKTCQKYAKKDNRITIRHQKNRGVSAARNHGLEYARGEWVTFIDADDWIEKNHITQLYNLAIQNNADISLSIKASQSNFTKLWTGDQAIINMLYYKIDISSWNKLYRRSLLTENNIQFNERLAYGEGFIFAITAYAHSKTIAANNNRTYHYNKSNSRSAMTNYTKRLAQDSLTAQDIIKNIIADKKQPNINSAWIYSYWHTNTDILNTIIGCKAIDNDVQFYKKVKDACKKNALHAMSSPVSLKNKAKALSYFVNPYLTAKFINLIRTRRFSTYGR